MGYVKQDFTGIFRPWFDIQNAEGETVLKMKGPTLGCSCYSDTDFLVSIVLHNIVIHASIYNVMYVLKLILLLYTHVLKISDLGGSAFCMIHTNVTDRGTAVPESVHVHWLDSITLSSE